MLVVIAIGGWSAALVLCALMVSKTRLLTRADDDADNAHEKMKALVAKEEELQAALSLSREDARAASYELKAEKKKRFDSAQESPEKIAPLQTELSQLKARMAQLSDARDAAQRQREAALAERETMRAERDEMQKSLAEVREALRAMGSQDNGSLKELQERVQRAERDVLTMRRRLEEQRRVHVLQRSEMELLSDKLAHVRGRYLHLCGDYVHLMREHPQRTPHADVFTLSGARELELLRQEHEAYEQERARQEIAG